MKKMLRTSFILFLLAAFSSQLHAQVDPTLSIQGILKKSNGVAVEDGNYNLVFKLYTVQTGGTAIWTETQSAVEVSNGIYSAVLGVITPLNIPFNQLYYLGVTVGSTELTPRILLTSAPYALSLIGQTNKFPSSGVVVADSIRVNGGVLARGGTPGSDGASKNGYAFSGNGGDKDSGLFSTANGEVSLYVNNVNIVSATPTGATVTGNANVTGFVTTDSVKLNAGGSISYNGLKDWRLIDVDDFETAFNFEGWQCYEEVNSAIQSDFERYQIGGPVNKGYMLRPLENSGTAFRKTLNLTGIPHTQVKVIFTAFFISTVDNGEGVYGGFSTTAVPNFGNNGEAIVACHAMMPNGGAGEPRTRLQSENNLEGWSRRMEMVVNNSDNTIYLFVDGNMNNEAISNENYGIANIEIWVK